MVLRRPDEEATTTFLPSEPVVELGQPPNITATNMHLAWVMTSSYNDIRGYRVFYKHNSYEDIKTFDGQKPEFVLSGLVPYTQYKVWVVPVGLAKTGGTGKPSENILQTTDTAEPSAPFITNVTCYETQKIYIEWKRPKTYYKTVDYYYIYYKAEDDSVYQNVDVKRNYCLKICAGTKSTKSSSVYKGEFSE